MNAEAGPKVSISLITYNHREYIAQAIESALMQETDFEYEIVIGEDDSSDGTREIVVAYHEKYPDKIRLFLNDRKNVIYIDGKPTGRWNLTNNLRHARGQYVAWLDGDDYWTSPHKLQRQADLLDTHPECTVCFHDIAQRFEAEGLQPRRPASRTRQSVAWYTLEDLLERNFIAACSVMYRNGVVPDFPDWFFTTPLADWPCHVLHAQHGKIGYIDEVMAMHRVHWGGIWSPVPSSERRKGFIRTLEVFRENLDPRYGRKLEESIARWHFKVLNALILEKDYRGAGGYARDMLLHSNVSGTALIGAAIWAARSKVGW
jgi:glycosyltransferase involved in cell wall biosynthesis